MNSSEKPYGIHITAVLRSLYRQVEALECKQMMAEADMENSDDDYDRYDLAAAERDAIVDELSDIEDQIAELEEAEASGPGYRPITL
jgi:hypothetical protein